LLAESQTPHPCSENHVDYSSPPPSIEQKIKLAKLLHIEKPPLDAKRNLSPQQTRWFVEEDPDYSSTAKPWDTIIYIGNASSESAFLKVSVLDHGNTFSAHWINDQLIFVQVWWGHIASGDLILDIDSGTFIYDRLANYGQLGEPCE
jgi:hypothetical protein